MIDHGQGCQGQPCTCGARRAKLEAPAAEHRAYQETHPHTPAFSESNGWHCTGCGALVPAQTVDHAYDTDTMQLASLIAQVLSGGTITGPDNLPPEVVLTAELIKDQGWTRCTNGCCGGAS